MNGHRADAVKRRDVAHIVERIASRGAPASANAALKVMRIIYRWGIASGRCETDPNPWHPALPEQGTRTGFDRRRDPLVWNLETGFRDAFRLQLLLAVRIGEALLATKDEINVEQRTWTIPACRTKTRREHRLPLSPPAMDIMVGVMAQSPRSPWLFPSPVDGKPMRPRSAATILQRLLGASFSSHDLRRSVATRLGDAGMPDEIITRVLNHVPASLAGRVYDRSNSTAEVKAALEPWAEQLTMLVGGRP